MTSRPEFAIGRKPAISRGHSVRVSPAMHWLWLLGALVFSAGAMSAEDFPNKPIRIVTGLTGGGTDLEARILAVGISGPVGQPVIVENRSTILVPEIVSKAPPDGYTLLLGSGGFMIGPLLQKLPYDPVRDFSPITMVSTNPNILVVHPSVGVRSVKELIAVAKAKPGELNYGSSTVGTTTHLAGELFNSMAGVKIVRVPYKGVGLALAGLMGGETQLMITSTGAAVPLMKAGKLTALAVTSAQPSVLAPGLPTVAATGLPGYEFIGIDAMFTAAKTPAAIINRLNQAIVRFLKTPDAQEKFLTFGVEAVGSSPEELGNKLKSEHAKWDKVIKSAGIRIE